MGSLAPAPASAMHILITGASGFIGQALAKVLLSDASLASLTLTDVSKPPVPPPESGTYSININSLAVDLTDASSWQSLVAGPLTHVYLLHGIMSGAAESNLELGLRVNIDSMRLGLDVLRSAHPGVRVIFPSSLAVFGPQSPSSGGVVMESTATQPQSSYGTQKAITEMLLNDYSRRGELDGRIVRLPTIIVRPGQPSGAASSFCSGIIREPLRGEKSVLPVDRSLKLWVCSTRTIIRNLLVARDIPADAFGQQETRTVNLPGITVTVQQMLDALREVGGPGALDLIQEVRDPKIEKIVGSWPAVFDTNKAQALGFQDDGTLTNTVREYVEDYGSLKS